MPPLDAYGHAIKMGDEVLIRATVIEVPDRPRFYNLLVETTVPAAYPAIHLRVNARQVERAPVWFVGPAETPET
jgi:hypothetical protein